ncbi:MAG: hypothetical protein LBI48_02075 [Burkholderiaceae bacterium]|nr:hypothetical protein [Burkholderiaceae bacterium]
MNKEHQTFEQGSLQALEMAICTLVRVLPEHSKQAFIAAYPQNVEAWDDITLPSAAVSDEWLRGLREVSNGLLRLVTQP